MGETTFHSLECDRPEQDAFYRIDTIEIKCGQLVFND
jgi:hypothetical protein